MLLLANKVFKELCLEREFLPLTRSHFCICLLHFFLLSSSVQLPRQTHFCLPTSCPSCLPSKSVHHSSWHLSISLLLLQITQKLCTFYQQRKLNTSIHCFFHAWLHTSLLLLLTVCIAEGAVGEKKKKKKSNLSFTEFLSIMICSNTFPVL